MQLSPAQRARLDCGSYVSIPTAMVYMETPKAACTSFKHLIAALNGLDIRRMQDTLMVANTSALAIQEPLGAIGTRPPCGSYCRRRRHHRE
jgi:hypothetical protein